MSFSEQSRAAMDYAQQLDWYLRRQNVEDRTEPFSDRHSSGAVLRYDLDKTASVLYGRVVDAIAYCHWYKVLPEGAMTPIPCCMLASTALTPIGVREHNQLQPNTPVWFIMHPQGGYGVILGVEPSYQYDGRTGASDFISLASRCGIQVDECHQAPFNLAGNGSIIDFSAGRPADATTAGEKGWFAETGVGIFVDSVMAFMKADENTGVWAFYIDQLLRVSARNLQFRSAGSEREELDDEGEIAISHGYAPNKVEALGGLVTDADLFRVYLPQDTQIDQPHYKAVEPKYDDQQPYHRLQHYLGYLAPGGRRELSIPPGDDSSDDGNDSADVNRYGNKTIFSGVFEETILPSGMAQFRTAKGFRIVKKMVGVIPKRVKRAEDATGDTSDGYRPAGIFGTGPAHIVTGDIGTGTDPSFQRAMGTMDAEAYGLNHEALLPFRMHAKDFHLPEESAIKDSVASPALAQIPFTDLLLQAYLDPPAATSMRVDDRYEDTDYYANISYIEWLDDGGMLIGDGWGSEIRMVGGSIFISCPGDLVFQPGRRLIGMATDVSLRAQHCAEIAATAGEVRVKAGTSLQMVGEQGVLIEDKSPDIDQSGWIGQVGSDVTITGITIKSARSGVSLLGEQIYLRSGVVSDGQGIFIDAGAGASNIFSNSLLFERYVVQATDYFTEESMGSTSSAESATMVANVYTADGNVFGSGVAVCGNLLVTCAIMAEGNIISTEGWFASPQADTYGGLVATLSDADLDTVSQYLASVVAMESDAADAGASEFTEVFDALLYAAGQIGNTDLMAEIAFSFRTTAQYAATDFRLHEARWQQLSRLWSMTVQTWNEDFVSKSGTLTGPFPGYDCWVGDNLLTQDLQIFDITAGISKDRSEAIYQDPQYADLVPIELDGRYRIINPF